MTACDNDHFERLYKETRRWIVSRLKRRLWDHYEAEDLFHDAFITYMELSQQREVTNSYAFLMAIAQGKMLNYKKFRRKVEVFNVDFAFFPGIDRSSEIHEVIEWFLVSKLLPEKARKIFGFARVLNRSSRQIGVYMGMGHNTACRHLKLADKTIRKVFEKLEILPEDYLYEKDIRTAIKKESI